MKYLIMFVGILFLFTGCNLKKEQSQSAIDDDSDIKKKELALKEKELELKEKEFQEKKERDLEERERRIEERESLTERQTTTPRTQTTSPRTQTRSGYPGVYPEASTRRLTNSDVNYLTKYQLKIMRNEIFARHGYIFQTTDMRNYFSDQSWYNPRFSNVNNLLSNTEKQNIELIKRYE